MSEEMDGPEAPEASNALELPSYQRAYLRGLAHDLKATVQVGQQGVTENLLAAVNDELLRHELVKIRMHEPKDKKAMAEALATQTEAALCGLVGHTVILYRPHPEEPVLTLPKR